MKRGVYKFFCRKYMSAISNYRLWGISRVQVGNKNLMSQERDSTREKSLSPLGRDPNKVGRLVSKSQLTSRADNPEDAPIQLPTIYPQSIGVNTSRIGLQYATEVQVSRSDPQSFECFKPITQQCQLTSSVFDLNITSQKTIKERQSMAKQSKESAKNLHKSPIGCIRRQPRSAPKQIEQSYSFTTPQLPSINKIDTNLQGFRKFVSSNNKSMLVSSTPDYSPVKSPHIGKTYTPRTSLFKKSSRSRRLDSDENQKLRQHRSGLNNSKVKLPTFRDQAKNQYQQSSYADLKPLTQQNGDSDPLNVSKTSLHLQESRNYETQVNLKSSLNNNSFIHSIHQARPESILIIDLRTSIAKVKQTLVESGNQLHTSFVIPEIFFSPPCSSSSSQELQGLMLQVFSHVGINPQIISIRKYVNCVVLRQRKLCIQWYFHGKVYFGGWQRGDNLTEGNKHGIGIEWVPSRYIYYGQFKDNKKEGYGVMKKSNKEVYIGCWKNNQIWGWGKVYNSEGQLCQNGQFAQGCFLESVSQQKEF